MRPTTLPTEAIGGHPAWFVLAHDAGNVICLVPVSLWGLGRFTGTCEKVISAVKTMSGVISASTRYNSKGIPYSGAQLAISHVRGVLRSIFMFF